MTETFEVLRVSGPGLDRAVVDRMPLAAYSKGEVVIKAEYSSLNYKDALAVTGKGKILRKFPLNPGIDVAGTVEESLDPRFSVGDRVVVTGCGLGENHDGGYSQRVRVSGAWVVPLPASLSTRDAMILGTAGFTAALCLHRLEANGQSPGKGPILVTGATGGVGCFSIGMLSQMGYRVHAITGKPDQEEFLLSLGASEVLQPDNLGLGSRPLETAKFGGVIDNVGGELLEKLIPHINLWGNIASVGLAAGVAFQATVMPFILRGVSILGISSNNCPYDLRLEIWNRLASGVKLNTDRLLSDTITLDQVQEYAHKMINRQTIGRVLVDLR